MTAAEALDVAIEACEQGATLEEALSWDVDAYKAAFPVLAALRDRLKEEEEFREAAMKYCGAPGVDQWPLDSARRPLFDAMLRAYRALRAVSKEKP